MPKIVVVGGGLAGLAAVIKAAEAGFNVDLISLVPVKRSHSVCAQGGINGAVNTKGEGDSPWQHFDDSVYGGDFLADQPPVKAMCEAAPGIIYLFDRMGVPFNRTPEGLIDFRRFGGTLHHRTAFAGGSTGQQLLYALDEQVRRFEVEGKVTKYEGWDFTSLILHEGRTVGCTAQNLNTMEFRAFKSDVVIMATGGIGMIFGKSTNSVINTGSAAAICYKQGVKYANGEFIQVHPTAIPGDDKLRLMSESIRGEGGRVWTYKDGKPWYFLEEKYPKYGNLVPRDIATREIFDVCVNMGLGVDGKNQVYLDVSHIPAETLHRKIGNLIDMYKKFVGDDATKVPMKIFPGMHYTMGGLWAGYDKKENGDMDVASPNTFMTNIPGVYALGEASHQHHGANRLGANSLVSCVFDGLVAGPAAVKYVKNLGVTHAENLPESIFEAAVKEQEEGYNKILRMDGPENPYVIADELGQVMTDNVTVVRYNHKLEQTLVKIAELKERFKKVGVPDTGSHSNQPAVFTRWLDGMLTLAEVIAKGALQRNESRGAHYKPDFPERDDEQFMTTTIAVHTSNGPELSYVPVDASHIKPRKRDYTKK
ncbi:MAG TPA: succinate dehydrogenase flavoprotein subunit [Symbiobacteriaceae bacterium]|jgi:succinate dehydrogenase / fumarate reductase flavoprotein subunit|nr:succinate dehydrogenase flavoprotein subunit [Symbiobacteriaceae bacterium]